MLMDARVCPSAFLGRCSGFWGHGSAGIRRIVGIGRPDDVGAVDGTCLVRRMFRSFWAYVRRCAALRVA
jgi:hypothetical protein